MANDTLNQLDTSKIAGDFNEFLGSQGLGDMNPSSAARYKQGVEVSPMDDILAMNGFDFDELFKRKLPEPPPLNAINSISTPDVNSGTNVSASDIKAAVKSLGLSDAQQQTLASLLKSGSSSTAGGLPAPMLQLIQSTGANSLEALLFQLGELHKLLGGEKLPQGLDASSAMVKWMKDLGTDDPTTLLQYLKSNPNTTKELLRDPLTGITKPLGRTTLLLQITNAFTQQSMIGSSKGETLVASRAGGTLLTGGGGDDLFVISLSTNPFPMSTTITDFDPITGSRLVLDFINYETKQTPTFAASRKTRSLKRLAKSNTLLILDKRLKRLFLNGNGKQKGFGENNGGEIAKFENGSPATSKDLLILKDNELFNFDGSLFS